MKYYISLNLFHINYLHRIYRIYFSYYARETNNVRYYLDLRNLSLQANMCHASFSCKIYRILPLISRHRHEPGAKKKQYFFAQHRCSSELFLCCDKPSRVTAWVTFLPSNFFILFSLNCIALSSEMAFRLFVKSLLSNKTFFTVLEQ